MIDAGDSTKSGMPRHAITAVKPGDIRIGTGTSTGFTTSM
jgi:hypothetical protein